jgi:hypothetical protein
VHQVFIVFSVNICRRHCPKLRGGIHTLPLPLASYRLHCVQRAEDDSEFEGDPLAVRTSPAHRPRVRLVDSTFCGQRLL